MSKRAAVSQKAGVGRQKVNGGLKKSKGKNAVVRDSWFVVRAAFCLLPTRFRGSMAENQAEFRRTAEAESALMLRIREHWHGEIEEAIGHSQVSPSFLAALTANESGGNPEARVFEPEVYHHLQAVLGGQQPTSGSFGAKVRSGLKGAGFGPEEGEVPVLPVIRVRLWRVASDGEKERLLREMATSWGLTQIMGYHPLRWRQESPNLLDPAFNYAMAVALLEELGRRFQLNLSHDFDASFRSWNTGHPTGATLDPDYVARGIQRMKIYSALGNRDE
jgi:hypothetical protein